MATKSPSSERNQVYISYSSPAEEEMKEMIVHELNGEHIEVATSELLPPAPREKPKQWAERKCASAAAVLILMSDDYQEDDECKAEAEAATILNRPVFFAKAKIFNENEWMSKIKGDVIVFDLTGGKYKKEAKKLIGSLKQVMKTEGTKMNLRICTKAVAVSVFLLNPSKIFKILSNVSPNLAFFVKRGKI